MQDFTVWIIPVDFKSVYWQWYKNITNINKYKYEHKYVVKHNKSFK